MLADPGDGPAQVVLLGTGSEVSLCLDAARLLAEAGTRARVVSLPSWELFADQDDAYRDDVLPPGVPTLSVEAASTFGWERYADDSLGIDHFGASAPGDVVLREFGFDPVHVAARATALLGRTHLTGRPRTDYDRNPSHEPLRTPPHRNPREDHR